MSEPKRIQRKRTKGWRMPEEAVYVGRPTRWGNPFPVGPAVYYHVLAGHGAGMNTSPADAVGFFSRWIGREIDECSVREYDDHGYSRPRFVDDPPTVADVRSALAGKDLACWCPLDDGRGNRVPCHADVLLELANRGRS